MLSRGQKRQIIDIHSHILPGLDDGSRNMEESLKMAKTAYLNGVSDIIVTPHYSEYHKSASKDTIIKEMDALQSELIKNNIDISLYCGNEIMRYHGLHGDDVIKNLSLNNSGYYLIEFKPSDSYNYIYKYLDDLSRSNIKVILAHIERYENIDSLEKVNEIRELGVLIQVNYELIDKGIFNKEARFLHSLLKEGLVDFVASDCHDNKERSYDIKSKIDKLYKKYDEDYVDEILYLNAMEILGIGK